MAEQTFKSPGFFEREIEIIKRPIVSNTSTPVGLIGPSTRGPAFVPTTVSSMEEFIRIFGRPTRRMLSGHAASEFFRNSQKSLTFCRTLGAGHYDGSLASAGFKLTSTAGDNGAQGLTNKKYGAVHFIAAEHTVNDAEFLSLGHFNDNDSHTTNMNLSGGVLDSNQNNDSISPLEGIGSGGGTTDRVLELLRAMIFTHKDYTVVIGSSPDTDDDTTADENKEFVLQIKHISNASNDKTSVTVSLDPSSSNYIANALNTDPLAFEEKGHLLYAHFPVDSEVAEVVSTQSVAVLHGDDTKDPLYGDFSSKFTQPKSPKFISQPFGTKEYDLFHFESLDDGAYASGKYKISISGLTASTDPTYKYGTFSVSIRDLRDTDDNQIVYETFSQCSLDPDSNNFIGKLIGDQKLYFSYETSSDDEKRLVREGSFDNVSTRVRVIVSDDVMNGVVPEEALPFGFRGVPALLLNDLGVDEGADSTSSTFVSGRTVSNALKRSVLPPLPYRFKITKGTIKTNNSYSQTFTGEASPSESVDFGLHWGLMTTRVEDINNPNRGSKFNELCENYLKFLSKSSVVWNEDIADSHNNNKFSLAKVALNKSQISEISGTVNEVFKNAVYVRNADADSGLYEASSHLIKLGSASDPLQSELSSVSLAKLLAEKPSKFNSYNIVAKFTAPIYGGFDGLNITDSDSFYMTDKAASIETGGKASSSGFSSGLKGTASADLGAGEVLMQGSEDSNNIVASFKNAIRLMTDDLVVNHNVLVVPNIRDPFVTDFAKTRVESYGKAIYLMDIPQHDNQSARIFVDERGSTAGLRADVEETANAFDLREVNSSYVSCYFPDAMIADVSDDDEASISSRRSIRVPSSVVALGALAKTDDVSQPWFAPAGFSRGALDTVSSLSVRLNAEDRDILYEARINPIANFPNRQFVIFGQKTSQLARTALDRVNVRRLVLEVKRRVEVVAQALLFEQNNLQTRNRFARRVNSILSTIRSGQGIEDFRVVIDETNNTSDDVDNNRLNGRVIIVPTRAIEFIAIDFVITNAGVEFP